MIVLVSGMPAARTQLTRTPTLPNSAAKPRVMASMAAQAAVMFTMNGRIMPLRLAERVTMEPEPWPAIRKAAARLVKYCEPAMTSMGRRKSASPTCAAGSA